MKLYKIFILFFITATQLFAQNPVLWFKADKGVNTSTGVPPTDNVQLTTWFDLATADGVHNGVLASPHPATPSETDLPSMPFYRYNNIDNFNFNPVVKFNATNNGQAVQTSTPTKGSQTVIVVFKSLGVTGGDYFYSAGLLYGGDVLSTNPTDGDPALKSDLSLAVRSQSRIIVGGGSDGDFNVPGQVMLNNLPSIGTIKRNVVGEEEVYLSMYASGTTEVNAENVDPTNERTGEGRDLINAVRIGKAFSAYENGLSSPFGKLDGSIAEVLVFNGVLTEADRAIIESYLAIKYGITLTGGTQQFGATVGNNNYNYVNSDGTAIRVSDLVYKYDVFGLGRDDYFELSQKISKSNNPNDILTVSTNSDFASLNLNSSRTPINGDKEFLLFANNKGSGDVVNTQTTELPAGFSSRIDREWKVTQVNTDGSNISNVSLRFDLSGFSFSGADISKIRLLVDVDGDGDFTTGSIQEINANAFVEGDYVQFDNLNLLNGQVITLAISENSDSDGDGVFDDLDLDSDNDGILDSDECGETNIVKRGNFTTLPSSPTGTGFYNPTDFASATGNNWTFTTTGTGTNAQIFWGNVDFPFVVGNAIRFQRDGQTQSIKQSLSGLDHYDGVFSVVFSKFAANNSNPNGNSSRLVLSYAGVEYMRVVTANGMNTNATLTYSNGATGSLSSIAVGTIYNNWTINLPDNVPSSGDLIIQYVAGPADSDDFSIGDIIVNACQDSDGDGIPDYLDLDSDNDGCYDSLEGDGSYTMDDLNSNGSINTTLYPVDGNGVPGGASQGIGESQNAAIADCACPFASGIDSDGDGIDDVCDLDDDNDGILDTDECPPVYTVKPVDSSSITVSGTIIDGTPQAIADGEGAGASGTGTLWYTNVSYLPITFSMDMQEASVIDHIKLYGPWGANEWIKSFRVRFYDSGNTLLGTEILTAPDQYLAGTSGIILAFSQEYVNVSHIEFTIISDQGYNEFYRVSVREIVFLDLEICDSDGDGIPNRLDLDSDNDGCPDAIEGDENVTSSLLNSDGSINIVANGGVDADGVPNIVNSGGIADVGEDQGQGIGASQDELITLCFCTEDPNTDSPDEFTKVGISTLANQTVGWPDNIPNGWLTMESKTKGFVITRVQQVGAGTDGAPDATDSITDPQEGMLVYDIDAACVKLFNGTIWNCIERSCNE